MEYVYIQTNKQTTTKCVVSNMMPEQVLAAAHLRRDNGVTVYME